MFRIESQPILDHIYTPIYTHHWRSTGRMVPRVYLRYSDVPVLHNRNFFGKMTDGQTFPTSDKKHVPIKISGNSEKIGIPSEFWSEGATKILYIKMNVYSSTIDVSTLFAPLEALNASADRIKLIQTRCTDISTSCTQNWTSIFRYRLRNNKLSKFNFKGMSA